MVQPPAPVQEDGAATRGGLSRRRVLAVGLGAIGAVVGAGIVGIELVDHGVLPGKSLLDRLDGSCSVGGPKLTFATLGPQVSGSFDSSARQRTVGYTVAWPPGFGPGDELPLVLMLHGEGGSHLDAVSGMSPAQLVAITTGAAGHLATSVPTAIVTVDGGHGYWHPHPDDDPMAMLVDELLPRCRAMGLGNPSRGLGVMGISMGGYGALALAEHHPGLVRAVAAISPAIWTSYDQARSVNADAYTDAAEFDAYDAVTHAAALAGLPVLVESGVDDPFHPGVVAFAAAAPSSTTVRFSAGCHTAPFFVEQEPTAVAFLDAHLDA